MKIANIREFRDKAISFLKDDETVLITKHGKVTGLLYPIKDSDKIPEKLFAQKSDAETFLFEELKEILKIGKIRQHDIYKLQKMWRFAGDIGAEIVAERDKR